MASDYQEVLSLANNLQMRAELQRKYLYTATEVYVQVFL